MQKALVIQTAFTGDVVLATAVVEKLQAAWPDGILHVLVRKGNEGLLDKHPFVRKVWIWDKRKGKTRNLFRLVRGVRREKYSHVINLHRFASSGLITALSGAGQRIGFQKNPLATFFTHRFPHVISAPYSAHPVHEVARNQALIAHLTDPLPAMPRLYPSPGNYESVRQLQSKPYVCVSPASVWATKQYPAEEWAMLIAALPAGHAVYLLGGPADADLGDAIRDRCRSNDVTNLCGALSFLQSAALMSGARMNYTNDSAPLHMCSAMNAPLTAVFCSTVPAFGFGPLRGNARVSEHPGNLYCRPCGVHGHRACPEGHFRCAKEIRTEDLLWWTQKSTKTT